MHKKVFSRIAPVLVLSSALLSGCVKQYTQPNVENTASPAAEPSRENQATQSLDYSASTADSLSWSNVAYDLSNQVSVLKGATNDLSSRLTDAQSRLDRYQAASDSIDEEIRGEAKKREETELVNKFWSGLGNLPTFERYGFTEIVGKAPTNKTSVVYPGSLSSMGLAKMIEVSTDIYQKAAGMPSDDIVAYGKERGLSDEQMDILLPHSKELGAMLFFARHVSSTGRNPILYTNQNTGNLMIGGMDLDDAYVPQLLRGAKKR